MRYEIKKFERVYAFNYIECMTFLSPTLLEPIFLIASVDIFFIWMQKMANFQLFLFLNGES